MSPSRVHQIALLEPSVASECVVTEMMGQIRCGAPFLAGALEKQGFRCRVFAEELVDFDRSLLNRIAREFDAVALSVTLNTLHRGLQLARALKARHPELPIAFGGPSASNFADHLLQVGDAVFKGRGEVSLSLWLAALRHRQSPTDIPGIILRQQEGLSRNQQPGACADGPTRYDLIEGFGPQTVKDGMFGTPKSAVYSLFASTGCIRQCRFCQTERTWRPRSHEAVIRDLALLLQLHNHQGPARIMLVDDCLFGDPDWARELLRRITHACRGHDVSFSTQFHVQYTADDELMKLFREAHFTSLALGFESTSQATLNHERKGTTIDQNDRAIEQCRRHGIVPYGYFVVGFDTDEEQTVHDVFRYIHDRRLMAQVLPVGLMSREEDGNPTPDAPRIFSDTSFGATIFVSHRPGRIRASRLQTLINAGYQRMASLRRLTHFSTAYERRFLFGLNRCFAVWKPLMQHHVTWLQNHGE